MHSDAFSGIETWVFDLDNTLYPPRLRLLERIAPRMTAFIADELRISTSEADNLRVSYWNEFGTTLAGLMHNHGVDPDRFLTVTHDIPLDDVPTCHELRLAISDLPGECIVFTNSPLIWADRVLEARGLSDVFSAVYGVETTGYHAKPNAAAYDAVFAAAAVQPGQAAMFEDDARNLFVPAARGMRTVLVADDAEHGDHIHHHTDNLVDFLVQLAG